MEKPQALYYYSLRSYKKGLNMPPVQNNTPAQSPKKPGFFARLFGKKKDGAALVQPAVSQTPPPQLNDTPSTPTPAPTVGNDIVSATPVSSSMPAMPVPNPVSPPAAPVETVSTMGETPIVENAVAEPQPVSESPMPAAASPNVTEDNGATMPSPQMNTTDQAGLAPADQDKPQTPQNPFA